MELIAGVIGLFNSRSELVLQSLFEHIQISVIAVLLICMVGIPVGLMITRIRWLAQPVIFLAGVLYTIPVLALFGFMIPLLGIGNKPTLFALFIYGLLPLIRNTYTGVINVDKTIVEAAQGMGSTDFQVLFKVQLPLAMPVIIAGVRTVTVMTVSVATIAAFIGAGGLGVLIFRGITTYNIPMIVLGSMLVAVLALAADFIMGGVEKAIEKYTV